MANVSRDVLRHAVLLDEGARRLNGSRDLQPPDKTTLITPEFDWDIRVGRTWQPETLPPLESHRAARLGHYVVAAARRPNLFGRAVFARAAGVNVEDTTFTAEHGYGPSQRNRGNRDRPYVLRIVHSSAEQPPSVISNVSTHGREFIDRFMALSLKEVVLSPSRSLEALTADYRRMEGAMAGLADTHSKAPLDGTIYYFNAGGFAVQIGGTERLVPGRGAQSDRLGWMSMNLFRVVDQRWELAAALDAESPTTEQPASLSAYELIRLGNRTQIREFDDAETQHVVALFEQLCGQASDYSAAYDPNPAPDKILEQARLSAIEVDLLPISLINVEPLNLQMIR